MFRMYLACAVAAVALVAPAAASCSLCTESTQSACNACPSFNDCKWISATTAGSGCIDCEDNVCNAYTSKSTCLADVVCGCSWSDTTSSSHKCTYSSIYWSDDAAEALGTFIIILIILGVLIPLICLSCIIYCCCLTGAAAAKATQQPAVVVGAPTYQQMQPGAYPQPAGSPASGRA